MNHLDLYLKRIKSCYNKFHSHTCCPNQYWHFLNTLPRYTIHHPQKHINSLFLPPLSLSLSLSHTHTLRLIFVMLNPANDLAPQPSSPTISSLSSSDLDTESTGSFFHDRSTTLGTLMGVTVQAITFRATSQHRQQEIPASAARRNKNSRAAAARQRRRWWRLCRDECDSRRASLGDYLEVERRFGDAAAATDLQQVIVPGNGRPLFADGMVLPPPQVVDDLDSSPSTTAGICRFSAVERWCNLV